MPTLDTEDLYYCTGYIYIDALYARHAFQFGGSIQRIGKRANLENMKSCSVILDLAGQGQNME